MVQRHSAPFRLNRRVGRGDFAPPPRLAGRAALPPGNIGNACAAVRKGDSPKGRVRIACHMETRKSRGNRTGIRLPRPFFRVNTPEPHTRAVWLQRFQQFSWLTHPRPTRSLLREFPNDRLSSCAQPPRSQWRYRPGFAPGSLFSARPRRHPSSTETDSLFKAPLLYLQPPKKSTEKRKIHMPIYAQTRNRS